MKTKPEVGQKVFINFKKLDGIEREEATIVESGSLTEDEVKVESKSVTAWIGWKNESKKDWVWLTKR